MKRIFVAGLAIWCFISCRKTPDLNQLTNNFVVATNRDATADFGSYATFAVSDTVAYISNVPTADTIIVGPTAAALLNAVKTNMTNRGYQLVGRNANPNLGLKVTVIKQVQGGVVYPPGWWWGYPGYPGYCYWGCYPPYYPYPIAYSYDVGDLIVEMLDLKNAAGNHQLRVIWAADAAGVLSSTAQTNIDKAVESINQAFTQSAYIQKN